MNAVPLAEAKDRLSALVADIATTHTHYTITRNGHPTVAMLPIDDLEALEETIFWLEREVERLRSGAEEPDGADISSEEMAELMRRRRVREGDAA